MSRSSIRGNGRWRSTLRASAASCHGRSLIGIGSNERGRSLALFGVLARITSGVPDRRARAPLSFVGSFRCRRPERLRDRLLGDERLAGGDGGHHEFHARPRLAGHLQRSDEINALAAEAPSPSLTSPFYGMPPLRFRQIERDRLTEAGGAEHGGPLTP